MYQGAQGEAGKKSVAYRLLLRSQDGTLTEDEIHAILDKMMRELEKRAQCFGKIDRTAGCYRKRLPQRRMGIEAGADVLNLWQMKRLGLGHETRLST